MRFFLTARQQPNPVKTLGRILLMALFISLLSACTAVSYYSQIVSGHMRIVMGKRPLAEIVSDSNVDDNIKHRLEVAQSARRFAIDELKLPDNDSYTSFYDTGKRFVTWNVVAAEEFSLNARKWCFPIAGCVSYRGYYAEEDAHEYARLLENEGLDTVVNGATAYSTLGWFKDPLLNTMIARSDAAIAALLFHELAHQKLYVGDDSKFNESFASFVEKQGLEVWQKHNASINPDSADAKILAAHDARKKRQEEFISLLQVTRDDLEVIYNSGDSVDVMREKKRARFEQMRVEYQSLKQSWDGYSGYDGWFSRELNNARLVSVGTYNDYIPAFSVLFKQSGNSFANFYAASQKLADLPADSRTKEMQRLLMQASAPDQ